MSNLPEEENLHRKHRDNLRKTVLHGGMESLDDHILLELLLFNSIPRRNTNDISRSLIEYFGDLKGVLLAKQNEITTLKRNAGETTALFLSVLSEACKRYKQEFEFCGMRFDTVNDARNYICADMKKQNGAVVSLLLIDSSHRVKAKITREQSEIVTEKIIEDAIKTVTANRCAYAFISFTHPNGIAAPDKAEMNFVIDAKKALLSLGIMLTDAVIVTPSDCRFLSDTDFFGKNFFIGQKRPNGQPMSEPIS